MKEQGTRLQECIEIRKQLTRIGAFLSDENRQLVANHMNAYIKDGSGTTFRLKIESQCIKVMLSCEKQSGVVLETI